MAVKTDKRVIPAQQKTRHLTILLVHLPSERNSKEIKVHNNIDVTLLLTFVLAYVIGRAIVGTWKIGFYVIGGLNPREKQEMLLGSILDELQNKR